MKIPVQNENSHIHTGKGAVGAKVDVPKSEQKGQKVRKALADISKVGNASLPSAAKVCSVKGKSAVRGNRKPESIPQSYGLTEEEIKRCNEWAKEGREHVHFSGNDAHAVEKDIAEERVKKKVDKVMFALREWTQISYGFERPTKDIGKESEEFTKLEPEPEVLLPLMNTSLSSSGSVYTGVDFCKRLCGVSVIRSFLDGLEVRVAFERVWKQSLSELSGGQRSLHKILENRLLLLVNA